MNRAVQIIVTWLRRPRSGCTERKQCGQVLIELALAIPLVLLPLGAGVVTFGLELSDYSLKQHLANVTARDSAKAIRLLDPEYTWMADPYEYRDKYVIPIFEKHVTRSGHDPEEFLLTLQAVSLDFPSSIFDMDDSWILPPLANTNIKYPAVRVIVSRKRDLMSFFGFFAPKLCASSVYPILGGTSVYSMLKDDWVMPVADQLDEASGADPDCL